MTGLSNKSINILVGNIVKYLEHKGLVLDVNQSFKIEYEVKNAPRDNPEKQQ